MNNEVLVGRKTYKIIEIIRELHDFTEYLAVFQGKKFIIKQYNLTSKMLDDVKVRNKLEKYGIYVPKYKKIDKKHNATIEEYLDSKNCYEKLLEEELSDDYYKELFNVYRFCRFSKIDLDYMPENFVLYKKKMYYTSFDYGPQNARENLENYGLYYWIYSQEFYDRTKRLGHDFDKKKLLGSAEAKKKIVLLSIMNW